MAQIKYITQIKYISFLNALSVTFITPRFLPLYRGEPDDLTYTLTNRPTSGTLQIRTRDDWVDLRVDDSFTHADVLEEKVRYLASDNPSITNINFSLEDEANILSVHGLEASVHFTHRTVVKVLGNKDTIDLGDHADIHIALTLNMGDGKNTIIGSQLSDQIDSGRDNDLITLDANSDDDNSEGEDEVIYEVAIRDDGVAGLGGDDTVVGFKPGEDRLKFSVSEKSEDDMKAREVFLNGIENGLYVVSPIIVPTGVAGLLFIFARPFMLPSGVLSGFTFEINFDEIIDLHYFFLLIGNRNHGYDYDASKGILTSTGAVRAVLSDRDLATFLGDGSLSVEETSTRTFTVPNGPIVGARVYVDSNANQALDRNIDTFIGTTDEESRITIPARYLGERVFVEALDGTIHLLDTTTPVIMAPRINGTDVIRFSENRTQTGIIFSVSDTDEEGNARTFIASNLMVYENDVLSSRFGITDVFQLVALTAFDYETLSEQDRSIDIEIRVSDGTSTGIFPLTIKIADEDETFNTPPRFSTVPFPRTTYTRGEMQIPDIDLDTHFIDDQDELTYSFEILSYFPIGIPVDDRGVTVDLVGSILRITIDENTLLSNFRLQITASDGEFSLTKTVTVIASHSPRLDSPLPDVTYTKTGIRPTPINLNNHFSDLDAPPNPFLPHITFTIMIDPHSSGVIPQLTSGGISNTDVMLDFVFIDAEVIAQTYKATVFASDSGASVSDEFNLIVRDLLSGGDEGSTLTSTDTIEVIKGGNGVDLITTGVGDFALGVKGDDDITLGGVGAETVIYRFSTTANPDIVNPDAPKAEIMGTDGSDVISRFERGVDRLVFTDIATTPAVAIANVDDFESFFASANDPRVQLDPPNPPRIGTGKFTSVRVTKTADDEISGIIFAFTNQGSDIEILTISFKNPIEDTNLNSLPFEGIFAELLPRNEYDKISDILGGDNSFAVLSPTEVEALIGIEISNDII